MWEWPDLAPTLTLTPEAPAAAFSSRLCPGSLCLLSGLSQQDPWGPGPSRAPPTRHQHRLCPLQVHPQHQHQQVEDDRNEAPVTAQEQCSSSPHRRKSSGRGAETSHIVTSRGSMGTANKHGPLAERGRAAGTVLTLGLLSSLQGHYCPAQDTAGA